MLFKLINVVSLALILVACDSTLPRDDGITHQSSKPNECNYLASLGVSTGDYVDDASEENEKVCFSDYINIGKKKQNNIAYYAYGTSSNEIQRIVLTLNISEKADEKLSLEQYSNEIVSLYHQYTKLDLNKKYVNKVLHHQKFKQKIDRYLISLEKNGNKNYSLIFEIKKM